MTTTEATGAAEAKPQAGLLDAILKGARQLVPLTLTVALIGGSIWFTANPGTKLFAQAMNITDVGQQSRAVAPLLVATLFFLSAVGAGLSWLKGDRLNIPVPEWARPFVKAGAVILFAIVGAKLAFH